MHFTVRFFGTCEESKAEGVLDTVQDGTFLIRESTHKEQSYEICLR